MIKDKRLSFNEDDIKQIHIAAAYAGLKPKVFMQSAVLSAAIMTIAKHKKK